jgi:hypothetical protein
MQRSQELCFIEQRIEDGRRVLCLLPGGAGMNQARAEETIVVGQLAVRFLVEGGDSNGSVTVFECYTTSAAVAPTMAGGCSALSPPAAMACSGAAVVAGRGLWSA